MEWASEVSLLRCVAKELGPDTENMPTGEPNFPEFQDIYTAYHLDDLDVTPANRVDERRLPDENTGRRLLSIYLNTVHPLFPILWKEDLMNIYRNEYMSQSGSTETELAALNLVFAIAQCFVDRFIFRHNQLSDLHGVYFSRAKCLMDLSGISAFSAPSLHQVQLFGLSGMYLVVCDQTNRAWNIVGLSLRMASALGLHLQAGLPNLSFEHQEQQSRAWYSLCYLESILCTMTGRPAVLSFRFCASNIPRALSHENGNNPSISASAVDPYLAASAALSVIIGDILGRLYSKQQKTTVDVWEELRRNIELLAVHLERWRRDLPAFLSFDKPQLDQDYIHKRFDLALRYNHASLLLHRPFLLRPEALPNAIEGSPGLKEFISRSGARCVDDARSIVQLLTANFAPDEASPVKLGPWWCILHYTVSSAAVLLLEMAQGGARSPNCDKLNFEAVSMLVDWMETLFSQGQANLGARNCCLELVALLSRIAPKVGQPFSTRKTRHQSEPVDSLLSINSSPVQNQHMENHSFEEPALYFPATMFQHEPGSSGFRPAFDDDEFQY